MERRWTRSQDDVGGPMGKNGGALRKHTLTPNTVSATCTVAATVQESLWNHQQLLSLLPPLHLQTSTTIPQKMPMLLFKMIHILIPFPMGFQVKNTGNQTPCYIFFISSFLIDCFLTTGYVINYTCIALHIADLLLFSWLLILSSEVATVFLIPLLCRWVFAV